MRRALDLARATTGHASPNPQVGCVLVRDREVVGEGAHLYAARDHAEIVALRHAGEAAQGATAYVTLEPCSHHGRTGPCADALIAAGVTRVVVATVDPNPQVSGRGLARLRAAGIAVELGLCEAEARALNDAFACFIRTGRPLVTLKAALSVDGMLAPPPASRTERAPVWLTGPESRAEVQAMRHAADAILTGIGTVLADDPLLTDRTGLDRRRPLLRVVLDTSLRTPVPSRLARSAQADLLIVCAAPAPLDRVAALEAAGAEVALCPASSGHPGHPAVLDHPAVLEHPAVLDRLAVLDLLAVLDMLAARQITSVLLECGSALNGAFLSQGLVDRVALFYAATELGPKATPFALGVGSPFLLEQSLTGVRRREIGPDVCVTGYLRQPWLEQP